MTYRDQLLQVRKEGCREETETVRFYPANKTLFQRGLGRQAPVVSLRTVSGRAPATKRWSPAGRNPCPVRVSLFTLIEVIVALAILTMGLLAGLSLSASSQQRLTKSNKRWHEQHMQTQAMEYYLLTNGTGTPPADVFPYPDYSVRCEWDEPRELPEGVNPILGDWKLRTMTVILTDKDGKTVRKTAVDRIMKGTD